MELKKSLDKNVSTLNINHVNATEQVGSKGKTVHFKHWPKHITI
jgi:hypothetical protein